MSHVAMKTPYLLKISLDEDAPNPRADSGNLGKMVCWHRRYTLGDEHNYDEPRNFLIDLIEKNVKENEILQMAKADSINNIKMYYNHSEKLWVVESYDSYYREWDKEIELAEPYAKCKSELAEAILGAMDNSVLLKLAEKHCCILPLYLFDHSGLHISTEDLTKWPDGRWDAGQIGWIYTDRKVIAAQYGRCGSAGMDQARKRLEGEVKLYDRYLAGECYGFVLYQYGEMEDSCWGFLGTFDEVKEDIACELPPECQDLLEHLVEVSDMQQMECEDYEELLEEMEV